MTTTQALPRLKTFAIVACRVSASRRDVRKRTSLCAEDEHALGLQRRVEAGQRQPRLLRVGVADRPIETGPPGQDLELDTGGDRRPHEGIDGHASNLVGHADVLAARRASSPDR